MTLRFTVPGVPRPQGSKKGFVVNGRVNMVESSGANLKDWRRALTLVTRSEAALGGWHLTDRPCTVALSFRFAKPARPKHYDYPAVKPDIDKISRAVLDAVTDAKAVWLDDSQVVSLAADKSYGVPGVTITIDALT